MATTELSLGEKQRAFARCVGLLLVNIYDTGYECTLDWAYRPAADAAALAAAGKGIAHSLHTERLAIDLNLFYRGIWLDKSEDHQRFGLYWKSLHPLARWGGDFQRKDGVHYSFTHEGRS